MITAIQASANYTCDGSEDIILASGEGSIYVTLSSQATKPLTIKRYQFESPVDCHIEAPEGKTLDGQGSWTLQNCVTITGPDGDGNFWFENND